MKVSNATPRRAAIAAMLVATCLLCSTGVSFAQTYPSVPTLTVDKSTLTPCEQANLSGTGFLPNSTVTISADGVVIGTVVTDASGNFTFPYMVSCTAVSGQITFSATDGVNTLSASVTVVSSSSSNGSNASSSGNAGASSGSLTTTGSNVEPLVRVAVLLIAAGGLLLLGLRRRDRQLA